MTSAPNVQSVTLQRQHTAPQHKKVGLGSGFLGPKGALFYQQLQCCRTRPWALLCNKLVRMNKLRESEASGNDLMRAAARLNPKGRPLGTLLSWSPFSCHFSLKCLFESLREMQKVGDWVLWVQGQSRLISEIPT